MGAGEGNLAANGCQVQRFPAKRPNTSVSFALILPRRIGWAALWRRERNCNLTFSALRQRILMLVGERNCVRTFSSIRSKAASLARMQIAVNGKRPGAMINCERAATPSRMALLTQIGRAGFAELSTSAASVAVVAEHGA